MSDVQRAFERSMRRRGLRVTAERREILDHAFRHFGHFAVDGLLGSLHRHGSSISRATVYRTLNEFVDAGLLRKFELDGRAVFEHDYGYPQHDHLYCKQCQKLIEFQNEELIELRNRVARDYNFRVNSHRLIISGICDQCARSRRRVKRKVDLI